MSVCFGYATNLQVVPLCKGRDLVELARRVEAHRVVIDMLADALETEPPDTTTA